MTGVLIAIVAVLFVFGVLIFVLFERRNQGLLYNALYETIVVFARSVERELAAVELLSVDVISDEAVQNNLRLLDAGTPGYEWQRITELLARRFATHTRLPFVQAIVGIDRGGRITVSRSDFPPFFTVFDRAILDEFHRSGGSRQWIITAPSNERLYYIRRVREIENFRLTEIGTLVFVIEKSRLAGAAVSAPFRDDMQLAVMDGRSAVFFDGDSIEALLVDVPGVVGTSGYRVVEISGEEYFLSSVFDPVRGLTFIFLVPYRLLFSGIAAFNATLAVFAGALLIVFVMISIWIARDVSAPIIELAGRMRRVEEADFHNVDLGVHSYERPDEIGFLYREFGVMLRRIDTLINENYRTQIAMKDTQFRSLQAQINPHFLYNTLESINWLAQLNDQEEITEMVQALGALLRISIDSKRPAITIAEEIEYLKQYLVIQKHRYGDRLDVTIDVPPGVSAFGVPALILQPLVENSLKYGLERHDRPCRIEIAAVLGDGCLSLSVRDDGPGMTESYAAAILAGTVEPSGSGVGIKNIIERFRVLFGPYGRITIDSRPSCGTTVTVSLPLMSAEALGRLIVENTDE